MVASIPRPSLETDGGWLFGRMVGALPTVSQLAYGLMGRIVRDKSRYRKEPAV